MEMKKIIKICSLLILLVISIGIVSATENSTDNTVFSTTEPDNYTSTNEEPLTTINQESLSNINQDELSSTNQEPLSAGYDNSVADRVEQSTIKDRTFKLGKYKITLNKNQYSDFVYIQNTEQFFFESGDYEYYEPGDKYGGIYQVSSTGLFYVVEKYTGKTVKQKLGFGLKGYKYKTLKTFNTKNKAKKYYKKHKLGNLWPYEYPIKKVNIKNKVKYRIIKGTPIYKKVQTRRAKVNIVVCYGGGQIGFPQKFHMFLTTTYQNPGYEVISGWICGSKTSKSLYYLNNAKFIRD